jgi:hypothetical protein
MQRDEFRNPGLDEMTILRRILSGCEGVHWIHLRCDSANTARELPVSRKAKI